MARSRSKHTTLPPPYLKRVWLRDDVEVDWEAYPYCLPLFRGHEFELRFDRPITIIVGENGTGKSTLLEAIAVLAGFNESGGGPGYMTDAGGIEKTGGLLAPALRAAWLPKVGQGWFFRAESFFSVARYLDEAARGYAPPPDYLSQSHGEGFLDFFGERCERPGIFIFDEPESALSPMRQLEFLKMLRRIDEAGKSQVILATHSALIAAYPGARLLRLDKYGLEPTTLEETDHFRLIREFALDWRAVIDGVLEG